jgi:hypothetical protein
MIYFFIGMEDEDNITVPLSKKSSSILNESLLHLLPETQQWKHNIFLVCRIVQTVCSLLVMIALVVLVCGCAFLYHDIQQTIIDIRVLISYAIEFFKSEGIIQR